MAEKKVIKKKYNVLDLFCGCGGMSHGLERSKTKKSKFRLVCGIDIWNKAIESYNENFKHEGWCKDLQKFSPKKCKKEIIGDKEIRQ